MGVRDFPGGPVIKNPSANVGDMGSIPDLERFHMLQGNQALTPQLEKDLSWPKIK